MKYFVFILFNKIITYLNLIKLTILEKTQKDG